MCNTAIKKSILYITLLIAGCLGSVLLWMLLQPADYAVSNSSEAIEGDIVGESRLTIEEQQALPGSYVVGHVPDYHYFQDEIYAGDEFALVTLTNYFEFPGVSPQDAPSYFPGSGTLVDVVKAVLQQRGYSVQYIRFPVEDIPQLKQLLVEHQQPLILFRQPLIDTKEVDDILIPTARILIGYDDDMPGHPFFGEHPRGSFIFHDLMFGNNLTIPYDYFVDMQYRERHDILLATPNSLSPTFVNKQKTVSTYPDRLGIYDDLDVMQTTVYGFVSDFLQREGIGSSNNDLLTWSKKWVYSPGFKKHHPLYQFERSVLIAKEFQDVGDYQTARSILQNITVPAASIENIDGQGFGEWEQVTPLLKYDYLLMALRFQGLMDLALEDMEGYIQTSQQIMQHQGITTDVEVRASLLRFVNAAPTYKIQHLRPFLEEYLDQ